MVDWREEFERKRRIEAARRLFYSHPSVAVRCRSLCLKKTKSSKELKTAPNPNLPSLSKNIEGLRISTILQNNKSYSAPSVIRSQKWKPPSDHQMLTQHMPLAVNQITMSEMLTGRQIFPMINNKANSFKPNNLFSSKDEIKETNNNNKSPHHPNNAFNNKGWGQRCQHPRPMLQNLLPEEIELSIKSIEPVLKNVSLEDLLEKNKQEKETMEDGEKLTQSPPPQVWKQNESTVIQPKDTEIPTCEQTDVIQTEPQNDEGDQIRVKVIPTLSSEA